MNNRLALFSQAAKSFSRTRPKPSRGYYTRHLYPYPFNYINTKVYPSLVHYRETYPVSWWSVNQQFVGHCIMKFFWTWWFYNLIQKPEVVTGHIHLPDPTLWTDEQLGIPADSAGSYKDWLAKKIPDE